MENGHYSASVCVCYLVFTYVATSHISHIGWLDKIDQTLFLDQTSVWDLICINFSSDNKHSVWSSRSVQNLVCSSRPDQISGLRPNLIWTLRSNWQLHNVKIQTFSANLLEEITWFFIWFQTHKQAFALGLNVQNVVLWHKYTPEDICTSH